MGTFRTCRAKHGFEYIDLLRPRLPASVLTWGNCIHAGLEAGYLAAYGPGCAGRLGRALEGVDVGVRTYHAEYLVKLDELVRDGHLDDDTAQERFEDSAKLLNVALWAGDHFFKATRKDLEGPLVLLGVEEAFKVPMYNAAGRPMGLTLSGVIDVLWWDPEMRAILVDDHKTVPELVGTTEKRIELDPQMSGYMHAAHHKVRTGELKPVDGSELPAGAADRLGGCRYNAIRRSMPKVPKVNKVKKNDGPVQAVGREPWPDITATLRELEAEHSQSLGLVSTAQQDTTGDMYQAALDEQANMRHLPVTDDQRGMAERLSRQGDRYFARFEFWRNADERDKWRREVMAEAKLMRWAERDPSMRTRNAGACSNAGSMPCAFRAVCVDDQPETRALYRVAGIKHEEVGIDDQKHEG